MKNTLSKTEAQAKLKELKLLKKQETELLQIINAKEFDYRSIKTLEDACKQVGKNYKDFLKFLKTLSQHTAAYESILVWVEAINGESFDKWLNWDDSNQEKWFTYWDMRKGGFVFADSFCNDSDALLGSRLYYKDKKRMVYAVNQLKDTYETYHRK